MTEESIIKLIRDITNAKPLSPGQSKPFEIRSYGKSELAMLYFPEAKTKKGAMSNLNYWINYNGELKEKLRALNSPLRAQHYTRREVELIVEYLCEP